MIAYSSSQRSAVTDRNQASATVAAYDVDAAYGFAGRERMMRILVQEPAGDDVDFEAIFVEAEWRRQTEFDRSRNYRGERSC